MRTLSIFILIVLFWLYNLHKEKHSLVVVRNLNAQAEADVYFNQFQRAIAWIASLKLLQKFFVLKKPGVNESFWSIVWQFGKDLEKFRE